MKYPYFFLLCCAIPLLLAMHLSSDEEAKDYPVVYGCLDQKKARCVGAVNCKACKNCRYCKYCNNGGACGVCERNRNNKQTTYTPRYSRSSKAARLDNTSSAQLSIAPAHDSKLLEEPDYLKVLIVRKLSAGIFLNPAFDAKKTETVPQGATLRLLATHGEWIKVLVESTNNTGFIHHSSVYLSN